MRENEKNSNRVSNNRNTSEKNENRNERSGKNQKNQRNGRRRIDKAVQGGKRGNTKDKDVGGGHV